MGHEATRRRIPRNRRWQAVRSRIAPSALAAEIRELDCTIARLEAEVAQEEATMTSEELEKQRALDRVFMASLEGLSLDEKIARLEVEIAVEEAT